MRLQKNGWRNKESLYAEDYLYIQSGSLYRFLMEDDLLTDEQKTLIAHGNAERIYHL